jgi:MYXO-CTERM domain-containing protein
MDAGHAPMDSGTRDSGVHGSAPNNAGCGCRVGASSSSAGLWALGVLAVVIASRRRLRSR